MKEKYPIKERIALVRKASLITALLSILVSAISFTLIYFDVLPTAPILGAPLLLIVYYEIIRSKKTYFNGVQIKFMKGVSVASNMAYVIAVVSCLLLSASIIGVISNTIEMEYILYRSEYWVVIICTSRVLMPPVFILLLWFVTEIRERLRARHYNGMNYEQLEEALIKMKPDKKEPTAYVGKLVAYVDQEGNRKEGILRSINSFTSEAVIEGVNFIDTVAIESIQENLDAPEDWSVSAILRVADMRKNVAIEMAESELNITKRKLDKILAQKPSRGAGQSIEDYGRVLTAWDKEVCKVRDKANQLTRSINMLRKSPDAV